MKDKLLVLDDETLILASLENLFEDDYDVLTTTDGEVALGLARKHDVAVILCDERMPGLSGHEFLRRAREVSKATRVMLSGYADLTAISEAVNHGQIFAYVSKPWDPLALKALVKAATVQFKLVREVAHERELLRALMENIPDSIYFKDRESRFTRVNRAHARSLGMKDPAECVGKSDADYFESGAALRWRLQEEEIILSGRPQVDRIEQQKKPEGALWWTSTTKVPMFDRCGQVSGIAVIARDITAVKNSEEALREQNERHRMILETASDAFIGMHPDGSITAWNPQAEAMFGWRAAEVMGRRWYDTVVAPSYAGTHAQGVEHYLTTAGFFLNKPFELAVRHRDGRQFSVEATVWPVRIGGVCSFNAFARDISDRRRYEDARKKEATLIQLLQSVTVAANRSSSIEHTAQACIKRICAYTGWPVGHAYLRSAESPEEHISASLWYLDEERRFTAFREASERCSFEPGTGLPGCVLASSAPQWIVNLEDQRPLSERTRAAAEAGLRSGFGFPILVDAKIMGVLEFFSLETAQPDEELLGTLGHIGSQLGRVIIRQRAEDELRRAKVAAESANLAKSEFLTTMSHEMRTPMNAILGMADLLAEGTLGEEEQKYVAIFQKAGANLLHLINDILDLSKIESGHLELESIGFDLGSLVETAVKMMSARAHERGLRLSFEILPGVPPGLEGDPNRLRQVLVNLIGNAIKFTEQGSVDLRVEPDPEGAKGWVRFSVVDTGIGIPADKATMIFDRFTQADSSITRKYGGTGLGLAISKALVELMGGRIGCISQPGRGSTFFLTAPFALRQPMASPEFTEPMPSLRALQLAVQQPAFRILIAEDCEDNAILLEAYLKDCGFELDFARDGEAAVQKTISGNPHVVLMDLQMPVLDGLGATRAIRQWEAKTGVLPTPILALTAHAAEEEIGKSLEAGCTEHLTKPIKKAALLEALARHIGAIARTNAPVSA